MDDTTWILELAETLNRAIDDNDELTKAVEFRLDDDRIDSISDVQIYITNVRAEFSPEGDRIVVDFIA